MLRHIIFTIFSFLMLATPASAQFDFAQNEPDGSRYIGGPRLGESHIQTYRVGIIIEPGAAVDNVQIVVPVPMDWREQRIISVNEERMDASVASRIEYRIIDGGAREMWLGLGTVQPTKPLEIVVAFELQNYELLPPDNPGQYVIPKRVPRDIAQHLAESPCIESKDTRFAKMFSEITKDRRTDWEKVEALYAFVQNNVKYDDAAWKRPAKGALSVIKMPKGEWSADCKDMTCLFVALCRAGKIPARVVRLPEHCYAEFYLELKQANQARNREPMGFWFPCQVSGDYAFGGIPEKRVILQKGDSFPDYESDNPKARTLFLKSCFQGNKISGTPDPPHKWISEAVVK